MSKLKVIIANYLLKHLFNTITADDILVYKDKAFQVAGKTLPVKDKQDIVSGARNIKRMFVWEMINKDIQFQANRMMYESSKNVDDMIFGKAILFTLDVISLKIDKLSKIE